MFIDDKADGFVEFEDKDGNMFQTDSNETKVAKKGKKDTEGPQDTPGAFINGRLYQ